jgi:hypothetical protein
MIYWENGVSILNKSNGVRNKMGAPFQNVMRSGQNGRSISNVIVPVVKWELHFNVAMGGPLQKRIRP